MNMGIKRKSCFGAVALAAVLALCSGVAAAAYPERPIRIVVPYAAGGGTDTITRMLAERMAKDLGQPVLVENRPGATGTIAIEHVLASGADGYTLMMAATSMLAVVPHMRKSLRYDPLTALVPVSHVATQPFFLVAEQGFAPSDVAALLKLAAATPDGVTYASFGNGSPPHLGGELLKRMGNVKLTHVPYKGGAPAITDVLAGRVHVMFVDAPPIVGHVAAKKLKVLAVSTKARSALMPQVPSVAETVPGFDFSAWFGIVAPAGTPPEAVAKLERSIMAILKDEAIRSRMAELGTQAEGTSAKAFSDMIQSESAKWKALVQSNDIKDE